MLTDPKNGEWKVLTVAGTTPGRRYGHSMVFAKPCLLVFGGNTGNETASDIWCLDIEKKPLVWSKLEISGPIPPPRVYHSAALCTTGTASGMMVIYGGRGTDQMPINDTWGLRKHRNGKWDWVQAPEKLSVPVARFQHTALFMGPFMLIVGGRTNNINDLVPVDVYDTETSEWHKFETIKRFRHNCWVQRENLYILGGFAHDKPSIPTSDLECINTIQYFESINLILAKKLFNYFQNEHLNSDNNEIKHKKLQDQNSEFAGSTEILDTAKITATPPPKLIPIKPNTPTLIPVKSPDILRSSGTALTEISQHSNLLPKKPHVLNKTSTVQPSFKIAGISNTKLSKTPPFVNEFIDYLLRPDTWNPQVDGSGDFPFKKELVINLAQECLQVVKSQPMVLNLRVPIKVFGDIHGQYQDLMRFFHLWCSPSDNKPNGDIECFDYLFLGDYVDRGSHSLETICLLMALKIKYPMQIHLLRGNHEDRWINNVFGFGDECAARFGEDVNEQDSVFCAINEFFDYLPLAAVIEDKVLCLHGGIGSKVKKVEQIRKINRPLEVIHEVTNEEEQLIVDILWSDPTDSDLETGIQTNAIRDPNGTGKIVKFGPDKVHEFNSENHLSLILRAHECVMDGFERFAGGELITVFSATDYCGRHKNAGAMLTIKRNYEIVPNLIYPTPESENNWNTDEEAMKCRPPTPPKWVGVNRENSFN